MPFPIDLALIRVAEEKLGVRFPPGFIGKMTRLNGGDARVADDVYELHPVFDGSDRKRAARTCNDVCRETAYMRREWPNFPQDAVVVARSGCGDRLVMFPEPTDQAMLQRAVFLWDHETGEVTQVAADFAELGFLPGPAEHRARGQRP